MPQETGKSFIFLNCPMCQGTGAVQGKDCDRCDERGVYAWLEGDFLHWNKKIDVLHIFEEEIERLVKSMINGFLIFFGLIGVVSLAVAMYEVMEAQKDYFAIFTGQSRLVAIFAVSLLTDLYAYYRMQRESLLEKKVKQKSFDTIMTQEPPESLFKQFSSISSEKRIEVSSAYTLKTTQATENAWQLARKFHHNEVRAIHQFAELLSTDEVRIILARLGVNFQRLQGMISRALVNIPIVNEGNPLLSLQFKKMLLGAYAEAYYSHIEKVNIPHLFLACIKSDEISREILYDLEVELDDAVNVVEWLNIQHRLSEKWRRWRGKAIHKPKGVMNKSMTSQATPLLDRFSRDMTSLARAGALAPCIGRDKEIQEALRVLEGEKNVIFSGFPGVGKTSIVEGIAELMASEEVPEVLQDKRLISLSVASLVGSSGRQGELEGRLIDIINEIVRSGNIVLFIDNMQNMVGVSTQGAENLDIADILASALQKRLFYCIATTTPIDYRRYIENSGTLTTVFQKVKVEELSSNAAIRVLEGKASTIEYKNQVYFSYDSIKRTVELTDRYIHERYFPEKAISILEEVALYVRKKKGKKTIVTGEDVAEIIANKTKIPVTKISEQESEKLINLEDKIHERLIDQEEAVVSVATALRRARTELRDIKRPIVNLLFLGPTGVGKTELAKTVAEVYFGSENNMIRLDMSEYQEKSSINRLIGAPPGHGQREEGGYLTEAVRRNAFSLILLDELEKAHPDILNIFLQVMDDGRLTDTLGRTIDFTNAIIIGTSNAGTLLIQRGMKEGKKIGEIKNELIDTELNKFFRPEFLNRFDNVVIFKPLGMEELVQITKLMLKKVEKRLLDKGISLRVSEPAIKELAEAGYDPVFGARPLRRAIQERVDNALANYLLTGKLGRRDVAVLESGGNIRIEQARSL